MKHLHSLAAARGTPLGNISEIENEMQISTTSSTHARNATKANSATGGIAGFNPD